MVEDVLVREALVENTEFAVVLILVVVEDVLVLGYFQQYFEWSKKVLILVVVEDVLVLNQIAPKVKILKVS